MTLLLQLILAHLIGDFFLQKTSWVVSKEEDKWKSPFLYIHVLIHGLLVMAIVGEESWRIALFITLSHLAIDGAKLQMQEETTKRAWFFADQFLHLLVIWVVCVFTDELPFSFSFLHYRDSLVIIVAVAFLLYPASFWVKTFINKWSPSGPGHADKSLQEAGKIIGMIERILIFIFILQEQWEAIGFLMAAKSVFRFGELKTANDRKLTEYILIGTLASFGSAVLIGLWVQKLMA